MISDIEKIKHLMQEKEFIKVNEHIQNLNAANFKIEQVQFLFDILGEVNKYFIQDTDATELFAEIDLSSAKNIIISIERFLTKLERPFLYSPYRQSTIFFNHVLNDLNNMRVFLKNPVVLELLRLHFKSEESNGHYNRFFSNHMYAKLICERINPDYFQNQFGKSILVQAIEKHHARKNETIEIPSMPLKSKPDFSNEADVLKSPLQKMSSECIDDLFDLPTTTNEVSPLIPDIFANMSEEDIQFHFLSDDIDEVFNVLIMHGADVNGEKETCLYRMDDRIFTYCDPYDGKKTSIHPDAKLLFKTMNPLMTPLFSAILLGYTKRVIRLLEEPNIIVNNDIYSDDNWMTNKREPSYLMMACYLGHEEIVKILLSRADIQINQQDATGETALFYAARANQPNIVKLLLEAGACRDVKNVNEVTIGDLIKHYQYDGINLILDSHKLFTNALITGNYYKFLREKCNDYYMYNTNSFCDEDNLQIMKALSNINTRLTPKDIFDKISSLGHFNVLIFDEYFRFAPSIFYGVQPNLALNFYIAWTLTNQYLLVETKVENFKMVGFLNKLSLISKVTNLSKELIDMVSSYLSINHILSLFDNYGELAIAFSQKTDVQESTEQDNNSLNYREGAMI